MDNASRFVFSGPSSWPLEQAIQFAVEHGFSRVDFNADNAANYPRTFTSERIARVRSLVTDHGVRVGIHSSSAVNMAEITPVMAAAADEYVRQNLDLSRAIGGTHVIVHGGFHFSSDVEGRFAASIERLKLAVRLAEERNLELHFENHNLEPEHAEIHYIPHTVAEARRFFGAVSSPKLRWACNVGHAMLVPDGFEGFLAAFGADSIGHVRLHDTNGIYEEHFLPGEGIVDFRHVFTTLHQQGYRGPFTLDFGRPEVKVEWRDRWAALLDEITAG
ncbi:MAG TPA: sugar phosphate isomerase/epimerase family protein [Chloroflexota bacterium]|nr:sugar phosphate isomerase/epimerase family protein [Chloroflexota bacterium]